MNKKKLENYSQTASIHTVTIRSEGKPLLPKTADLGVIRSTYMQRVGMWYLRINPNKLHGDIFAYSEFCANIEYLCSGMKITPTYYRCDIRLDNYEENFESFYKMNLLLISLFSILFNDSNGQAVSHLLTCSKVFTDISTQNNYWEVKYYDKSYQSHDVDSAKARLEFRCLRATKKGGYAPHEIKEKWFKMLDKLPSLYSQLLERCNQELKNAYEKHKAYNSKLNSQSDCLTSFLSVYSNGMSVFTREQLRAFLMQCGLKETAANSRADYIIDRVYIEFFSKADIERYIKKIKDAMNDFFEC